MRLFRALRKGGRARPSATQVSGEAGDEVTLDFTAVTNQCLGEEPSSNSFATGRLVCDPDMDAMWDDLHPDATALASR